MKCFDSVLVANRGEIAVRVIGSARDLGYRTIAVYSEADSDAPHVALADEAVLVGPPPVRESYLDMQRILDAARRTEAGAIHPGYGFLSENAQFAAACAAAGIVFIGPSAQAIELMGNKAAAKRRMLAAGVPCIPGFQEADADDSALISAAAAIGYPLMVKAAAGGGGRGMRLVAQPADLPPPSTAHARRRRTRLAAVSSSWKRRCYGRGTWKYRCSATARAITFTLASGTVPCSGGTRRWSRKRPARY
jgi:geranyl-CoA carboxylase alpha subunit